MRDFVSTNRSPETHTRASLVHLCLKLHAGSCGNREPLTLLVTKNCSKAEDTAWNASTSIAAMLEAQLVSDKRSRKISVSHVHSIVRWAFSCGTNGVVHTTICTVNVVHCSPLHGTRRGRHACSGERPTHRRGGRRPDLRAQCAQLELKVGLQRVLVPGVQKLQGDLRVRGGCGRTVDTSGAARCGGKI